TPVLVHSRVDERTWNGSVTMIDWDNPMQQENMYMSYGNDTVSSSRYAFYVELEEDEGLMMGQHVYLEMNYGQTEEAGEDALLLPSYYLNDIEGNPWVWAQDEEGNLEKRKVVLGEYEEETDCYFITEGLEADDFIAFPEENREEGMKCILFDESALENTDEALDEPSMSNEAEVVE
ncbi:MAG: efflux RND transporter periplasmic adaptor subunit, partial [Ruminococcus sp.]|nr:efflux RND transporter periplasmic adaptor subunit [Ruminococcus sp.]